MSLLTFILILFTALLTAALILGEIFFIPGIGIIGILGLGGFIGLEVYLIGEGLSAFAIWYAILSIILFVLGFYLLSRNKFFKKVELTDTVDEVAVKLPSGIAIGDKGIASSRLTLGGIVRIGKDTIVEAESEEGFINEGEAIYISDIRNNKIFVRRNQ